MANTYKQTLNLPKTDFSMRASLATREPEAVKAWDEDRVYDQIVAHRKAQGAPPFILHDGPPYANGNIHHGHILNKVLKDFVVKHRSMAGYVCEFVPGWDCHGLPIEHNVDKKLGSKRHELSKVDIRKLCREYADGFVDIQRDEFKRMMIFADWDNPYKTMDYTYEATTVRELGRIFERGLAYRGLKSVHWDWAAQTALAEAEVEYSSFTTDHVYVKFPFFELPGDLSASLDTDDQVFVVIWTTTPWTLPANFAIALNPTLEYRLVRHGREVYILASALMESTLKECRIVADEVETLCTFKGSALVGALGVGKGLKARHAWLDRDSLLLPADYVTTEQGTGCVHTAPGHGQEDFELGKHFGIVQANDMQMLCPVNKYGKFMNLSSTQGFEGLQVHKANPAIVEWVASQGRLLNHVGDKITIDRYPHGWRSKKPLIMRSTTQWFIAMEPDRPELRSGESQEVAYHLRERALEEIETIHWLPKWGRDRIQGMVRDRPDWCISRQRSWGVPIVAMHCNSCGHVVATRELTDHVATLVDTQGVDVWFAREPKDLLPKGFTCPECAGVDFSKEEDILDVWFDSGTSWSAVLETQLGLGDQADLYLEGSDQHRGWFQSSMMAGLLSRDHAPYKTCLTHGFLMDEQGHKYSKSSKNFEPPAHMINKYGGDVLRLWVSAVDYRGDITLSTEILQRVADAYRKARNTIRFMLGNLDGFDPNTDLCPLEELEPLDRWILHRAGQTIERISQAYEEYQFHTIYHALVQLTTVDLSNVFMDVSKDRMYCEARDDVRRRSGQTAFWLVLDALLRAVAPILTFTTQEAWALMPRLAQDPKYIFLADVPKEHTDWIGLVDEAKWEAILELRSEVQRALEAKRGPKKNKRPDQIGSSQEAHVRITASSPEYELLLEFEPMLVDLFIVSQVELIQGDVAQTSEQSMWVDVTPSAQKRCPRCWNHWIAQDVDDELCTRCARVLGS